MPGFLKRALESRRVVGVEVESIGPKFYSEVNIVTASAPNDGAFAGCDDHTLGRVVGDRKSDYHTNLLDCGGGANRYNHEYRKIRLMFPLLFYDDDFDTNADSRNRFFHVILLRWFSLHIPW